MRTAIDRLTIGEEKEINIFEFDGYKSRNRFVCPECGEYVFAATGKRNSFKHYKGKGIDCDLRVDSPEQFTFFQRVGLPIYLLHSNGVFSLNIGFYGLGETLLKQAQEKSIKVVIGEKLTNDGKGCQFLIDSINFFTDDITMKRLNFIPIKNNNYKISFNIKNDITETIENKWSNFADGFSNIGGLFTYSESKGKKIRKNDTITTSTDYYFIKLYSYSLYKPGLETEKVGNIKIDGKVFEILKIIILPENTSEFKTLEDFFWNNLKLKLLFKKPDIVQLWPPATKSNDINSTICLNDQNHSFFCKIDSDVENTKVYSYLSKNYREVYMEKDMNKQLYINHILVENMFPLSVNRKFLANAQFFQKNKKVFKNRDYKLYINDIELNLFNNDMECLELDTKIDDLLIKCDLPISIVNIDKNMNTSYECINCMEYDYLKISKSVEKIVIYSKSLNLIILKIKRKRMLEFVTENSVSEKVLLKKISPFLNEKTIRVPLKFRLMSYNVKKYRNLYKYLKNTLVVGEIQPSILKILKNEGVI